MEENCIFCKIINKQIPSTIVAENGEAIAFKTIKPIAEHHILIAPKTHIKAFVDLKNEHKDIFMDMINLAIKVIEENGISDGSKLAMNGGKYQSVPHLHWHILAGKLEDEDNILN